MTTLAAVISLALGVYLSMRTIAALYRAIDLSYAAGREWLRITRGIAGWGSAAVVAAWLSNGVAFAWGFAGYAVAFVALYVASRVATQRMLRE